MASYSLLIKASAAKGVEDIEPKALRRRVVARIEALADDSRPPGCEKLAGQVNLFRVREGVWRIAYTIDDSGIVIMVDKVGRRRDVYQAR
ncbi:MAG: type II toxin-antitoxin system RelE/ParE family toxin [Ardenticatenia bacterium]|nr:type II toxin-antitoxin system RelE/ParE family toxin [Ardenticatenia bacterium]